MTHARLTQAQVRVQADTARDALTAGGKGKVVGWRHWALKILLFVTAARLRQQVTSHLPGAQEQEFVIRKKAILAGVGLLFAVGTLLSGCAGSTSGQEPHALAMASMSEMPMDVQQAPVAVLEAYQFAVANRDVVGQIPCYCGCGAMGHKSNYDCYVAGTDAAGQVTFDSHALGCSICVDISQDTMRLLRDGQTVAQVRDYVDRTYAQYGPSNMP